ncbi:MAG: NTP transferase domain-containing protein [Anaerolineales bacterium]|nr:NTP transferase domain-containing protein [Anaerolineales bacterium]
MSAEYFAVIMAGGGGTRLWPLSRQEKPKQVLRLFGDRTMFQVSVDRLLPILDPQHIFVVTVEEQAGLLGLQVPDLPSKNFLLEPAPRGTASVVGLAAIVLQEKSPGCVTAILTADHYIPHHDRFQKLLLAARDLALEGDLVTLGITPAYPDTGYGYIHRGESRGVFRGYEAYRVEAFKEKPDLEQAQAYLENGQHAWNSGMFVWKAERILEEIERQMPDLFAGLREIAEALGSDAERDVLERVWKRLASQTVDYGIMEGAKNVSVIPADDLGWIDVGGWRRLFDILAQDGEGNIRNAPNLLMIDTKRTLVFQDAETTGDRLIAALGLEDLIIVDAGDVVLVCPKDQAERVREIVQTLREQGLDRYL